MMTNVSHEFRTPLNAIMQSNLLMEMNLKEALETIEKKKVVPRKNLDKIEK